MSIFANEHEGQGLMIGPGPEKTAEVKDGFEALGNRVPMFRRSAAYEHAKAMGVTDKDAMFSVIEKMCDCIERDDPHGAMEAAYRIVDVTGVYRLLAVLLTAREAQP